MFQLLRLSSGTAVYPHMPTYVHTPCHINERRICSVTFMLGQGLYCRLYLPVVGVYVSAVLYLYTASVNDVAVMLPMSLTDIKTTYSYFVCFVFSSALFFTFGAVR